LKDKVAKSKTGRLIPTRTISVNEALNARPFAIPMLEFGAMDDPLRIPDDKRGSGGLASFFEWPDLGWGALTAFVVLIALNCWFDYYHPRAILIDIILVAIWAVKSDLKSGKN
jgi:hypothetical protein